MTELCVAGSEEFIVGFQLAGINKSRVIKNAKDDVQELLETDEVGILVLEQSVADQLPDHLRKELSKSVSPVVVILSEEGGASHLRQDIIRAIGVDLWKGENE